MFSIIQNLNNSSCNRMMGGNKKKLKNLMANKKYVRSFGMHKDRLEEKQKKG